jgi:D-3-phosphoglycerate dehydrogenase
MNKKIWSISPSFGRFVKSPITYLEQNGFSIDLLHEKEKLTLEHVLSKVQAYDALIPGTFPVTAEIINSSPNLKIVAMAGSGVDHIDIDAATKRGVMITNVPGTNSKAVAELAIGFVFALAREIVLANNEVKHGKWHYITGRQVGGKTLGIVGMGKIGKELAKLALSLNMKVIAFDAFPDIEFSSLHGIEFCELEELMKFSDFISIHVPLIKETDGLIDEKKLRAMKPTAYLMNLSRGRVVDESALYNVLSEKAIAGAALDVFAEEPPQKSPLLSLANIITTPHMGGYTYEALHEIGMGCARSIVDLFNGRKPENIVNSEVIVKLI